MENENVQEDDELGAAGRLAQEIRRLRLNARLSQKRLADLIGYTREYLAMAEKVGGNVPSLALVRALDGALQADGVLLELREQATSERRSRRAAAGDSRSLTPSGDARVDHASSSNGEGGRLQSSRDGSMGLVADSVLLPVLVEGRPVYLPVHAVDLFVDGPQEVSTGVASLGHAMDEWEAMSPLNRRLLLRHGVGVAASPWFTPPGTASHTPRGSALPGRTTFSSTSWAAEINDVVLNPTGAIKMVEAADTRVVDFAELRLAADDVLAAHLSSDYARLTAELPSLIGRAESTNLRETGSSDVQALLSDVYAVAAWSLIKADSSVAAWVAAERSIQAAEQVDDVLRVAAATRCLSEVHMRASNFEEATRTAFLATVQLDTARPAERRTALCLRGAALLSGAAAAARRGDSREAHAALRAAATCAEELGEDRSDLGTVFGPTNVAIHEVAVAVELGNTRQALRHVSAVTLDRMPTALTERRARFLIDVARAHRGQGDDQAAFGALLQAEQIAPDELREHRLTQELVRDLLSREHRSSGVRQLAARCNVLN